MEEQYPDINFSINKIPHKDDSYVITYTEKTFHNISGKQLSDIVLRIFINEKDVRHLIDVMKRVLTE